MNGEFSRADLEVTGAILRCEGSIVDLATGRVLDLSGLTVDEAARLLALVKDETFGIGWAYSNSVELVPAEEGIVVIGAEGQRETFTSFLAVKQFKQWAGKVPYWKGRGADRQRRYQQY